MKDIPSLAEQRVYAQNFGTGRASDVPERMDEGEENRDFKSIVAAKEVASSGLNGKLRAVLRVSENGGEAVPTTIVEVIELGCGGVKMKRKNTALSDQNTDMERELVKACAVEGIIRRQLAEAERRTTALKTQSADPKLELEKLAAEMFRTEANL